MPVLLDGLTFAATPTTLTVAGWPLPVTLKPYQVLVTVSVTPAGTDRLPADALPMPAILDTGHNHTLSLREDHLTAVGFPQPWPWSSTPLRVRDTSGTEREVPRLLADVWLHGDSGTSPYPLRLGFRGIACYLPTGIVPGPHLPLLGMAALCAGSVSLEMHCRPDGGTVRLTVPSIP